MLTISDLRQALKPVIDAILYEDRAQRSYVRL